LSTIDDLAPRLWLEAVRQGVRAAVRVVWLSDGGWGLWTVFQRLFQAVGAVAIIDFYPAAQNLYKGASAWLDGRTRACQQWFADLRHRLRHGHEQHVLVELAALVEATHLPQSAPQGSTIVHLLIVANVRLPHEGKGLRVLDRCQRFQRRPALALCPQHQP
jgi:hypothetical protein